MFFTLGIMPKSELTAHGVLTTIDFGIIPSVKNIVHVQFGVTHIKGCSFGTSFASSLHFNAGPFDPYSLSCSILKNLGLTILSMRINCG
jgi:hypothetical protein